MFDKWIVGTNWLVLLTALTIFKVEAQQKHSQDKIAEVANEITNAYADMGWFNGTVLIKQHDKTLYHKSFGLADRAKGKRNQLETKYNLGSIAKDFTQVLVLQMVEQGKLSLDDTIGKFDLGFAPPIGNTVTIGHLLNHSSGFGDIFTPQYQANRMSYDTLEKKLQVLMNKPLLFAPGSSTRYSNYGYNVLGAIVQKVSGKGFEQLLKQNIFSPLGMKHTSLSPIKGETNQSLRYSLNYLGEQRFVGVTEHPGPDGGIESTTEELDLFFAQLFDGDKLLSKTSQTQLKASKRERSHFRAYGGGLGISSAFEYDFDSGYRVTVLSNSDKLVAEHISARVMSQIQQGKFEPVRADAIVFTYTLYQKLGKQQFQNQFTQQYDQAGHSQFKGRVLNELAMTLSDRGEHSQAIELFEVLLGLYPKAPQPYDSLAWGLKQSGDNKSALNTFAKALKINPTFNSDYSPDNYKMPASDR